MFSNVVCIGDSYTNEHEQYRDNGIDFSKLNYEFKSYPQILGEKFDCKWETFGKPGMPMPYSLQILIDRIDYIQKLENPLVIYQFGFFDNVILSKNIGNYTDWKNLSQNHAGLLHQSTFHVINKHSTIDFTNMSKLEKVGMLTFLEKFGALSNFHLIEQFLAVAKLLKRSNISIYGLFLASNPHIDVPKHDNILYMGEDGCGLDGKERMTDIFPQLSDSHKTTQANQQISDEIYEIVLKKHNIERWSAEFEDTSSNLI